jgi:hypothetical protein
MIKTKITLLILALLALVINAYATSKKEQKYESPDGKYIAYVIALPKAPSGSGESKIIIKTRNGKTLRSKSYWSEDGEHGFGVEKSAWSPDSSFFIYSMSSSGGHQSWHFPTYFISTSDFKVRYLDDYLGPITDPDFKLSSPNTLETIGRDKDTLEAANFKIKLKELIKIK